MEELRGVGDLAHHPLQVTADVLGSDVVMATWVLDPVEPRPGVEHLFVRLTHDERLSLRRVTRELTPDLARVHLRVADQ